MRLIVFGFHVPSNAGFLFWPGLTCTPVRKTAEKGWTHASRVKGPLQTSEWEAVAGPDDLKLTLKRTR